MNIRRGLLGLWIVGSIAWIGIVVGVDGYVTYSSLENQVEESWRAEQARAHRAVTGESQRLLDPAGDKTVPTAAELYARINAFKERESARSHLKWRLVPPAVILVLGASVGWALAGFRGTRRGNTP